MIAINEFDLNGGIYFSDFDREIRNICQWDWNEFKLNLPDFLLILFTAIELILNEWKDVGFAVSSRSTLSFVTFTWADDVEFCCGGCVALALFS